MAVSRGTGLTSVCTQAYVAQQWWLDQGFSAADFRIASWTTGAEPPQATGLFACMHKLATMVCADEHQTLPVCSLAARRLCAMGVSYLEALRLSCAGWAVSGHGGGTGVAEAAECDSSGSCEGEISDREDTGAPEPRSEDSAQQSMTAAAHLALPAAPSLTASRTPVHAAGARWSGGLVEEAEQRSPGAADTPQQLGAQQHGGSNGHSALCQHSIEAIAACRQVQPGATEPAAELSSNRLPVDASELQQRPTEQRPPAEPTQLQPDELLGQPRGSHTPREQCQQQSGRQQAQSQASSPLSPTEEQQRQQQQTARLVSSQVRAELAEALPRGERQLLGAMCKRLIDMGRVHWLQQQGLQVCNFKSLQDVPRERQAVQWDAAGMCLH